jgi:DNA-binding NarL/FixJ family response regulator
MARAHSPEIRREVLRLLGQGLDAITIGKRMNLKPCTIRQIKSRSNKARQQQRSAQLEMDVRWLVRQVEDLRRIIGW